MIEAYAFLAMFTLQILTASILYPTWFIRYFRAQATSIPPERLAQVYPDVDLRLARERFFTRYRTLNTSIAVLGLLLLGWLFNYTQRPDWDDGRVVALVSAYYMAQMMLPLGLVLWFGVRFDNTYRQSLLESKRKASLQRRALFDFVSPFAVFLAVASYVLFAAFVIYLQQHPFLGFAGLVNTGAVTLVYAVNAFAVYAMLYGKKPNPFESHAGRARTIALTVKSSVYSCIVVVAYLSLNFTLKLFDLQRWEPFALSVFFAIVTLLCVTNLTATPSPPEEDGLHSHPIS